MKRFYIIAAMSLLTSMFAHAGRGHAVEPYPAPMAEGVDQNGNNVKLETFYKKGITLVYFYPKAGTPGCTAQACSLRDAYDDLTKAGVQVIGVSMDKVAAEKKFADKNRLPFTLLADREGKIVKAFGVRSFLGFSSRQAFLIKDGKVIWHDRSASTKEQAADVLKALKEMNK